MLSFFFADMYVALLAAATWLPTGKPITMRGHTLSAAPDEVKDGAGPPRNRCRLIGRWPRKTARAASDPEHDCLAKKSRKYAAPAETERAQGPDFGSPARN